MWWVCPSIRAFYYALVGCIIKASDNRLGGFGKRTEGDETSAMVVVLIILVAIIGLALLLYLASWNR